MRWIGRLLSLALLVGGSQGADNGDAPVWHNWHKTIQCNPRALSYPTSGQEVQALVRSHEHVRAVGLGHSFNNFTCGEDLMISTIKLNKPVALDRRARTATFQAGMSTREVLEWLADRDYTLETYSYYIDQTIAGAVATDTHGSSTTVGSMANLLRALTIVTADGSLRTLTPADGELWQAAKVSVGMLGVVVEVTMAVVPDVLVDRNTEVVGPARILQEIALAAFNPFAVDQVQYFFSPESNAAIRTSVGRATGGPDDAEANRGTVVSNVYYATVAGTPGEAVYWAGPMAAMTNENATVVNTWFMGSIWGLSANPGTFYLSDALPVQSKISTESLLRAYGKYDQYEFAIPIMKAFMCFSSFLQVIDEDPEYKAGFRVPMFIRYVRNEDHMIGISRGGTFLYLNIDNYHAYKKGGVSPSFEKVKALMRSSTCTARMHYGKASVYSGLGGAWTQEDADYVRSTFAIGGSFERFVSIVRHFDPTGKFADAHGLLVPHSMR